MTMETVEFRQGDTHVEMPVVHLTDAEVYAVGDNRDGRVNLRHDFRRENRYLVVHVETGLMLPAPSGLVLRQKDAIEFAQFAEDGKFFDPISGRVTANDRIEAISALRKWTPSRLR